MDESLTAGRYLLLRRNQVYVGVTRGKRVVVLPQPALVVGDGGVEQLDGAEVSGLLGGLKRGAVCGAAEGVALVQPAPRRMCWRSRQCGFSLAGWGRVQRPSRDSRGAQTCASAQVGRCWPPSMEHVYTRPLADDELRPQLQAMVAILFDGQTIHWHEVERQVDRLGFGHLYIVSSIQGQRGNAAKISLKPALTPGLITQIADASACVSGGSRPQQPSI